MFSLLVPLLIKSKEKHLQVMMPATYLFWECIPLEPEALSLLSEDCTIGRNSLVSMNFKVRLLWAWCCRGMLVDHSPYPFHCLLVCLLMPPLLVVSAKVFAFFVPWGAGTSGMLDSCNDGGSVPF